MRVRLAHDTDLAGFRRHARALLAAGAEPHAVRWSCADGAASLFDADTDASAEALAAPPARAAPLTVPAFFGPLCDAVALHRDAQRFALLYRLLWRLRHEPALRHDTLDADRQRAERMAREVRQALHKMRAFVRFRPVARGPGDTVHVAWFEPGHHIVEANAPFFARRFAGMRWALLTPLRCACWDGHALAFGPGASRLDAPPADAGEALWLTYYASIFNPARPKPAMMRKEMPCRYWRDLPEAALVPPLLAGAHERTGRMLERPPSPPGARRRGA